MLTVRVRSGAFVMIKLEEQYEYSGTVKAISEFFKKLKDKDNDWLYHFVVYDYDKENGIVYIKNQRTAYFEELNPECLQVSAQGKGVLQIKNGWLKKRFEDCFVEKMNRTEALVHLAKKTVVFCDKQLEQKTQIKKDMKYYLAKVS